jgi:hypothetical protein
MVLNEIPASASERLHGSPASIRIDLSDKESSKLECPRPGAGNPEAEPTTKISAITEASVVSHSRNSRYFVAIKYLLPATGWDRIAEQKDAVDPKIKQQIRGLAAKYDDAFNRMTPSL